ncbi:glycosyltransferase [Pantoea sp. CTOTU46764]|uniref:glycosyltransferase n=1 Tax=Pantoea sp. CTOTU46764 TaxID=2953854 RepID=UPI0028A01D9D|nr:glycosyltransferase [Pantoea sp. CTOTU46764]
MNATALIVTFNRLNKLIKTIEATLALPFQHIVIVNNASTDNTSQWLSQLHDSRIKVIESKYNIGGAGGFYLGAEFISKHVKTKWIVFYDDDAYPEKDFLNKFESLNPDEHMAYCSKVLDLKNNICTMNKPWIRKTTTFTDNFLYCINKDKFVVSSELDSESITFSFVGCIISHDILEKTYSNIDRKLFIYYDDVFYSYFLLRMGVKIRYEAALVFRHDIVAESSVKLPPWKIYYLVRNIIIGKKSYGKECFFSKRAIAVRLIVYFIHTLKSNNIKLSVKYYFKGVSDGLRNLSGKRH